MPRGGARAGAGLKPKITSEKYVAQYEQVWGPFVDKILMQKLIDAIGYDPTRPIDPRTNPETPPDKKERNDILDRLIGPAHALHAIQQEAGTQVTFLDILIQSNSVGTGAAGFTVESVESKVIDQPKQKLFSEEEQREEE